MYMYLARSKMSADAAHDVGGPSSEWWDECVLRLKRPVIEMLRIYETFKKYI